MTEVEAGVGLSLMLRRRPTWLMPKFLVVNQSNKLINKMCLVLLSSYQLTDLTQT